MKKAAIYTRVSTIEQKNGYSLDAQKDKMIQYCQLKELEKYEVYEDGGFSGGNMNRPELSRLIRDIEAGQISHVLVYKLDRLSRNQRNTLYLIEEVFQKHDVGFVSLQENFDTTSSFGRAMIGIISTFAQLERDTIAERMKMGRVERAKKGLYRGSANVATGYSYVDGKLIRNDDSAIVEEIFDRFIDGESTWAIYSDLSRRYPGKIYGNNMITRILENPIYTGKVTFDDKTYDGIHDPIIDQETFDTVQQLRKQTSSKYKVSKNKRSALLARKLFCGHCGKTLFKKTSKNVYHGQKGRKEYVYTLYQCNGRKTRVVKKTGHKCTQASQRTEKIDTLVLDQLNELDYKKAKKRIQNRRKQDTDKKVMDQLYKQEKRLMDLYQLGSVEIDELDKRLKEIRKEKEQIKESKQSINEKKTLKTLESLVHTDIYQLDFLEQCEVVDTLIDKVIITDDNLDIRFNF